MSCCILVASHIRYDEQLDLLKECLESLSEQTYKADIYVSISFDNDIYKTYFINNTQPLFKDVIFLLQKTKKYQLEHLKYLSIKINDMKKYDWVFFCDDDDKYTNNRVELFMNYINTKNDDKCFIVKEKGNYKGIDKNEPILIYWLYVINPNLLFCFFNQFIKNDKVLKDNNADYLLKAYFERCHNIEDTINDVLYLYNQCNIYSIHNNKKNEFKKIMYYNVVNFDENNNNILVFNKKSNKEESLTKKDYINNVPHYHLLKDTLKTLYRYDML